MKLAAIAKLIKADGYCKGRVGPARTPEARRTAGKQKRRGQPRRRGTCRE